VYSGSRYFFVSSSSRDRFLHTFSSACRTCTHLELTFQRPITRGFIRMETKPSEISRPAFWFSFPQPLIMDSSRWMFVEKALASNPTPLANSVEPTAHDKTPENGRSANSPLRPLEIARQRLHARESEPQRLTPLEEFQRLFPLVDPSSPGLPYTLFREYLFRCKRCDHVILKSRREIHMCPAPPKTNGRMVN
jgi:hypothetical protein